MGVLDCVILGVIALILGLAGGYILRVRKKGTKCIGCPDSCCSTQNFCPGCNGCSQK